MFNKIKQAFFEQNRPVKKGKFRKILYEDLIFKGYLLPLLLKNRPNLINKFKYINKMIPAE